MSYDVRRFGAMGDGVANDTAAVQQCINEATAAGQAVELLPGVYSVEELTLPQDAHGLTIQGSSPQKSVLLSRLGATASESWQLATAYSYSPRLND